MSQFVDVIPSPSDEQLWRIKQTIEYAALNDPYVNYDGMIRRGYRLITPEERYYYEESIKREIYDSIHSKKHGLWVEETPSSNFQHHRQKLKHNKNNNNNKNCNNDSKYQENDDDDFREIYLMKRKAIEANGDSTTSNNDDIPTRVDNKESVDDDVDSAAVTVGRLLHQW